jgi:hypothetical protein
MPFLPSADSGKSMNTLKQTWSNPKAGFQTPEIPLARPMTSLAEEPRR